MTKHLCHLIPILYSTNKLIVSIGLPIIVEALMKPIRSFCTSLNDLIRRSYDER